jgi:hypothetical protein
MKPNPYAVARSLEKIDGMTTKMLGDVIHRLTEDGHVASDGDRMHAVSAGGMVELKTPIEAAANKDSAPLLRQVTAQARRLGVSFDPEKILSISEVDRQLAGKPILDRLAFKHGLAMLNLIA